jgi:DNA gyrase subunit A
VHEIPDVEAAGKGKAIANLVSMEPHERIAALLTVREWEAGKYVVMGTRQGVIKKTELTAFSNPRAGGIIAMGVEETDAVIAVRISDGSGEVLIATRNGMAIRFPEDDVRAMGRTAYGVRGISLRDGDEVVAMEVPRAGTAVLTLTEHGYGKRTPIDEYRVTGRGGLGIINIQTTERNGRVVGVASIAESDEVMFITQQGKVLRTSAGAISLIGRNTQGVRLIDMEEADRAVSLARFEEQEVTGVTAGAPDAPGPDDIEIPPVENTNTEPTDE